MFRVNRLIIKKTNVCNIPLLTQFPSKQLSDIGVLPDTKDKPQIQGEPQKGEAPSRRNVITNEMSNVAKTRRIKMEGLPTGLLASTLLASKKGNLGRSNLVKETLEYSPAEVIKVLKIMAGSGNRIPYVLKLLSGVIKENNWMFTLPEISDILYSFAKLSYKDMDIFELIRNQLQMGMEGADTKVLSSISYSLGALKYRDCELLDMLLKGILQRPLDIKHSISYLMSLSFLNYSSPEAETLIKFLAEMDEVDFYHKNDFINYIWACTILNKLHLIPPKQIKSVLSENFFSKLLVSSFHMNVKLKLLNIRGGAEMINFNESSVKMPKISIRETETNSDFLKSVIEALTYILPNPGHFRVNVDTGAGFYLDIQCSVNSENSPKVQTETEKSNKAGILLLGYKDLCSDNTPTGIFAFKTRLLRHQGYQVLTISYTDYPINAPLSEKISFLKNKML